MEAREQEYHEALEVARDIYRQSKAGLDAEIARLKAMLAKAQESKVETKTEARVETKVEAPKAPKAPKGKK